MSSIDQYNNCVIIYSQPQIWMFSYCSSANKWQTIRMTYLWNMTKFLFTWQNIWISNKVIEIGRKICMSFKTLLQSKKNFVFLLLFFLHIIHPWAIKKRLLITAQHYSQVNMFKAEILRTMSSSEHGIIVKGLQNNVNLFCWWWINNIKKDNSDYLVEFASH